MDINSRNQDEIANLDENISNGPIVSFGDQAKDFVITAANLIDFAFQPIVDIHNGMVYGYEAFLRNYESLGFQSIQSVFDRAQELDILHRFDTEMRKIAIRKFAKLPKTHKTKLFYNLDTRILSSSDYVQGETRLILQDFDLSLSSFCIEIAEQSNFELELAQDNLTFYKKEDCLTVIDNFGSGYYSLKLLRDHTPDLIKLDRTFIDNITQDKKSKLMVSTITGLAHTLGIFVVAKGVETELELRTCKELGCDLVQGNFICKPSTNLDSFKKRYGENLADGRRSLSNKDNDSDIIYEKIEYRPPLRIDDTMETVFEAFRRNKEMTFFPVVDEAGSPLGLIQEKTIKEYTYSPFGTALIANKGAGLNVRKFLTSCPVADINSSAQSILENYSLSNNTEGIIIVREFGYLGFLSASSLLHVINQKNLTDARDSSPLTKLPGNSSINEFVNKAYKQREDACSLVYLDLDNFKAFNDAYGFRQGDRAIMLFAELMRKHFQQDNVFLGHVGGDDFFIGLWNKDFDRTQAEINHLLAIFKQDVVSFYDQEARKSGYLMGKDRQGNPCEFPLMSCSAALINLHPNRPADHPNPYELDNAIVRLKKRAKASSSHLAVENF